MQMVHCVNQHGDRDEGNISRAMSLLREAAAVLTQGRQINTSLI
jgi:hypothetical protein